MLHFAVLCCTTLYDLADLATLRRQERRVRRSSELSTIDDADDSKPVDIDDDSYQLSVLPARRFSVRDIPAPSLSSAASEDAGTGADGTGCCGRLGQKLLGSRSRVVPEGGSLSGERQRGVSAVAQNSTALCETSTPSDLKREGLGALLTQGSQKLSSMQHTSSSVTPSLPIAHVRSYLHASTVARTHTVCSAVGMLRRCAPRWFRWAVYCWSRGLGSHVVCSTPAAAGTARASK
jgi:hypothetical protein